MSGYPKIPTRASFGPTYRDEKPVDDPETELGADVMNLAFWQVAGAGRTLPRAVLLITGATNPVVSYQLLAFDPNGVLAALVVARSGLGDYSITFEATYTDEQGNAVAFAPKAAVPVVQGAAAGTAAVATVDGQDVDIEVRDIAAAGVDSSVLLLVW